MNGPFILTVACLTLPWELLSLWFCCLPVSRGGFQSPHGYLFTVRPCRSLWGPSDTRAPCRLLAIAATHQAHVTPIFTHLGQRRGKDKDRLQVAMCGFSPVCQAKEAGDWLSALISSRAQTLLLPAWQSFFQQVSLPQRAGRKLREMHGKLSAAGWVGVFRPWASIILEGLQGLPVSGTL